MTREETYGLGAGGRYRADIPFTRFPWGDVHDRRGRRARRSSCCRAAAGKYNRIRTLTVFELREAPGGGDPRGGRRSRRSRSTRPTGSSRPRPAPRAAAQLEQGAAAPAGDPRGGPRPRRTRHDRRRPAQARHRAAVRRAHHVDCRTVMSRRLLLIVLALRRPSGSPPAGDKEETVTNGESEAVYVTLGDIQYQVQLSRQLERVRAGRPRPAGRRAGRASAGSRRTRSGSASGCGSQNGTDGSAEARRRVPHQGHDRRASSSRCRSTPQSPFAYRSVELAGDARSTRLPDSASGRVADDRRVPALPHAGRRARLPAARARVRQLRAAGQGLRGPPRRLSRGAVSRAAGRPRGSRARPGRPLSPPAPAPTSRTPTAIRGVRPVPGGRVGDEPGVGVLRVRARVPGLAGLQLGRAGLAGDGHARDLRRRARAACDDGEHHPLHLRARSGR